MFQQQKMKMRLKDYFKKNKNKKNCQTEYNPPLSMGLLSDLRMVLGSLWLPTPDQLVVVKYDVTFSYY